MKCQGLLASYMMVSILLLHEALSVESKHVKNSLPSIWIDVRMFIKHQKDRCHVDMILLLHVWQHRLSQLMLEFRFLGSLESPDARAHTSALC